MDVFINLSKVIENYFIAWRNYDLSILSAIFSSDARYEIRNKNRTFNGIEEICKYWLRNSKRQKDVSVFWKMRRRFRQKVSVIFVANFYDTEEKEFQEIDGVIDFTFNKDGKIEILSEEYVKKIEDKI